METATSGKCIDKTKGGIRGPALTTTYRFNKTIATATISFIVTVAIVVYKGSISVVGRMLTFKQGGIFELIMKPNFACINSNLLKNYSLLKKFAGPQENP